MRLHVLKLMALLTMMAQVAHLGSRAAVAQVPGIPGQAAARATVNVAELASMQQDNPPGAARPQRRIPFMTGSRAQSPRNVPAPPRKQAEARPAEAALSIPSVQVDSPAPAENFEALDDNNTEIPPGTNGAVGPNHLMVTLNSQVRIQSRAGATLSTVSLESFWSSLPGVSDVYSPRILFDRSTFRWIFAAVSNRASAASSVLIGVSVGSDPQGTWNLYRVDVDATNVVWGDFPTLGFNKDWIVVSTNVYRVTNSLFEGSNLYVFRKSNLLAGASALFTLFETAGFTQVPAITHDTTHTKVYLVEDKDGEVGETVGEWGISNISGTVGAEVYHDLSGVATIPGTWANGPTGLLDFATQSGSAEKIQTGDSRMSSAVFRNGYLWAAHTVFLPLNAPTRTAVQWGQFLPTGFLEQSGRIENLAGPIFYAYPSIAVNSVNDVLLGFSIFSASQFASAGYAMRAAADILGTLRDPMVLKAGEAAYVKKFGGSTNSWGDYSAAMVDPVNDLHFWTIQEYADSPLFAEPNPGKWGTWWGRFANLTTPPVPPPSQPRRRQIISQ